MTTYHQQVRGMSAYKDKAFDVVVEEEIAELEAMGIRPDSSYETFRDRSAPLSSMLQTPCCITLVIAPLTYYHGQLL